MLMNEYQKLSIKIEKLTKETLKQNRKGKKCQERTIRTYRHYESGHTFPSPDTLVKIADTLNISIDYLLGRDELNKKEVGVMERQKGANKYGSFNTTKMR